MSAMGDEYIRVNHDSLRGYLTEIFVRLGVPRVDALTTADVLVQADLRGVDSHGVQRLGRYVNWIKEGLIDLQPTIAVVRETAATALVDGGNGLGQPVSKFAMEVCLDKAARAGAAFVAVRNSNHFGIAAYYSMMAIPRQCIGFSFTNSRPFTVPTYGREQMIGTNPLSIAVPSGDEAPFVLDMATSVVPFGKIEVAVRKGLSIPLGWAVDSMGEPTTNPVAVVNGGGTLPLGGTAEFGGYKGYGLAVMVDILCGVLSGAGFGRFEHIENSAGSAPANIGHFFGALCVDAYRPLADFKEVMDGMLRGLKDSKRAAGESRIFVAGEKEHERETENRRDGVPIYHKVAEEIRGIGSELGVEWNMDD